MTDATPQPMERYAPLPPIPHGASGCIVDRAPRTAALVLARVAASPLGQRHAVPAYAARLCAVRALSRRSGRG